MNHSPLQRSDCAAMAPFLPLVPENLLSENQAKAVQTHLENCAMCRADLAAYERAEAALRRTFVVAPGTPPPFLREEIRGVLTHAGEHAASETSQLAPFGRPQHKRQHASGSFFAFVAALILILLAVGIFRFPVPLPRPAGNGTPAPGQVASVDLSHFILNSISMVSPEEGWAVGTTWLPQAASTHSLLSPYGDPVILHYSQGQWRPVTLPAGLPCHADCHMVLHRIVMVSSTEGWAIGNSVLAPAADGVTFSFLLHYLHGQWSVLSSQDSALSGLSLSSAHDGWIVGKKNAGWGERTGGAPVFHFTDSTWEPVNDPAFQQINLRNVVALSATNVWLDGSDISGNGFDGDDPEVILQYDGRQWTREKTDLANSRLAQMAMVSATSGWAVGCLAGGLGPHPAHAEKALVEQYRQGRWFQSASFSGPSSAAAFCLNGIALVSAGEGWAVGSNGLIVHESHGLWMRVSSPTDQTLNSVVMLSPTEGWAVGDQGTILHYLHGSWHVYQD